jgi:hypothetical protein
MSDEVSHPIEGQIVLLAGSKASVSLPKLSDLLERAQQYLADDRDTYDQRFERLDGAEGTIYYLAPADHWTGVGADLDLTEREIDALGRAHAAQFRRDGRRLDREDEFETTLEIRDVVAISPPA